MTALRACGSGDADSRSIAPWPAETDEIIDETIEFWSDAMAAIVGSRARRYANRWFLERDDIEQECRVGLIEYAEKHGYSPIRPSLVSRICRDKSSKYRDRFRRMTAKVLIVFDEQVGREPQSADIVMDVRGCVDAMRPQDREVVEKRFRDFRSLQDLAEAWGMKFKGVVKRQSVAFDALRGGLGEAYGPGESRLRTTRKNHEARHVRCAKPSWNNVDWTKWGRIPNQREDD